MQIGSTFEKYLVKIVNDHLLSCQIMAHLVPFFMFIFVDKYLNRFVVLLLLHS